ncbi:major capsid protein [Wohlfahrtiimonas chitiniclastica]|uniref:major capsid protein n=1 Tax=Wohlfahrtiimonas chitiniclastica TaxID=400946 RepID=UPI0003665CA0|nr:major capsid protein [Wohlfahrtiimonas chitiniclastica]OYQ71463.1 hypothetical protein B9T13_01985 [Wohlfahrtiimonas chitiniclastica]
MLKKIKGVVLGVAVTSMGSFALADDSAMMGKINAQLSTVQTNLESVGVALVIMAAVVMGFRWLKASFF